MQIRDLDYDQLTQAKIIGGLKSIANGGAAATSSGRLSLTKTRSLTQVAVVPYGAASSGRATAMSIARPYKNTTGILASGRATVSSLGTAQS
jgi:hypothetical protein